MKTNLISCALKGLDHSTLIENILDMAPEYWLAERMITGIYRPTIEELLSKIASCVGTADIRDIRNLKVVYESGFVQKNITVYFKQVDMCYSNKQYTEILDSIKDIDTKYGKDDVYKFPVKYLKSNSCQFASEDFE